MNKQKKLLIDQIMGQVEEYTLVCSKLGTPFDDPATVLKKTATWKNLINLLKQSICTNQNQQDAETEEIQSPILSELSTHLEKWRRAIVLTQVYKFENDPTDWNSELESIDYAMFALSKQKAQMTKQRPTKTGWFWYKLEGSWALQPCYVFSDGNDLLYTLDSIGCNERIEDLDGLYINEADVDTLWSKEPIANFVMGAT
jgi:hypothetical protein